MTVLFADVVDSTGLGETLDPEEVRALLGHYFEVAREVLTEPVGASIMIFSSRPSTGHEGDHVYIRVTVVAAAAFKERENGRAEDAELLEFSQADRP